MQTLKRFARSALSSVRHVLALFGVETWGDWRALIHVATPLVVAALMTAHVAYGDKLSLLGALIVAITSPTLAALNSANGFRTYFYQLLVPLQLFLVGWGFASPDLSSAIIAVVTSLIGSGVAAANTETSK